MPEPNSRPEPEIGVIGLGRMARAILLPLIESGDLAADKLVATVARASSVEDLNSSWPVGLRAYVAGSAGSELVWQAPMQLLGIKPQQVDALAETAPEVDHQPLLISVLAGVTLDRLQRLFPGHRCVRAVPNTPALVGAGLTALAWGRGVTPDQQVQVKALFASVGDVLELPEDKLDAFLALTSSGPAFIALVAEAMADGAVAAGLARDLAHHLAHRTLAGTAELLHQRALHPAVLKDMVSSPAGTTIAGLRALERGAVRSALIEAVMCAAERSRELA